MKWFERLPVDGVGVGGVQDRFFLREGGVL